MVAIGKVFVVDSTFLVGRALGRGESRVDLEELRLKRMVVTDKSLELLSRSFMNFKSLVLVSCEGFTTDGLAAIAANCR